LVSGSLQQFAVRLNFGSDLAQLVEECVTETGNLEARAHEGISNLGYGVFDNLTVLEDDHVSDFLFAVLHKRLLCEMGKSLTAGRTEEHPCHSHWLVTIVDGTGDETNVDAATTK